MYSLYKVVSEMRLLFHMLTYVLSVCSLLI